MILPAGIRSINGVSQFSAPIIRRRTHSRAIALMELVSPEDLPDFSLGRVRMQCSKNNGIKRAKKLVGGILDAGLLR